MTITHQIPDVQRDRASRPLPGITPVGQPDWITVTADYGDQLTEKARLTSDKRESVYCVLPEAEHAASELLEEVLVLLRARADFCIGDQTVRCPDGRVVPLKGAPLLVLSQLLQEDLCIHIKRGDVHHLMGAILCFPASWTLAEKIGKPLVAVHRPVPEYDASLAKRVQRLFDGVQVGQPLWRANYLRYDDPALFQPKRESDPRHDPSPEAGYVRSERQTLFRLPKTRAVVFAIHTTVARLEDVADEAHSLGNRGLG